MTDPAGTCHLVGCPGKGVHAPHGIGVGTWEDYATPERCLASLLFRYDDKGLAASCAIDGQAWSARVFASALTSEQAALLVDQHRNECPNRLVGVSEK